MKNLIAILTLVNLAFTMQISARERHSSESRHSNAKQHRVEKLSSHKNHRKPEKRIKRKVEKIHRNQHRKQKRIVNHAKKHHRIVSHHNDYRVRNVYRTPNYRHNIKRRHHKRHHHYYADYRHHHYRGHNNHALWHAGHGHYHYDYRYRNQYNHNRWYSDDYYLAYFDDRHIYDDPYYCPDDFGQFVAGLTIGALIYNW